MSSDEVIVIGLGGVGSAAAYHLARSGCRVLGLEQFTPAHALGSSHGATRIIRQAYFEHPSYVPLLRRAYQLWDELQLAAEERLFLRTGLVEMGPADGVVIPGVLRSAREHGLDIETLSADEVSRRFPGLLCAPDATAVIETNAGYLRVEACVAAHLRLAEAAGARLRFNEPVVGWSVDGGGVRVECRSEVFRVDRLVIAGGPWSGALIEDLGIPLRVLRKHLYWYAPQSSGYRQDEGMPCFFHETPQGYFYGFPAIDALGVKLARHDGGREIPAPSTPHPEDPEDRHGVEAYASQFLPDLGSRLTRQAGCYYTVTPDEHFIVDRHPRQHQVTVVAGLSGHGFKFASVLGELACRLALEQPMSLDTALLRIQR